MKKILYFTFILLTLLSFTNKASADLFSASVSVSQEMGGSAMQTLIDNVTSLTRQINTASSQMMKVGDMLTCNARYGKVAYWDFNVPIFNIQISLHVIDIFIWIYGMVLYIIGFFLLLVASFYLFDVAFNLSTSIVLLPLGLALWPFAWTREKLRTVVQNIVYYTGLFMFLPLGVLIATRIAMTTIDVAFQKASVDGIDFVTAYEEDQSEVITEIFSFSSFAFWKIVICYVVCLKIIPLLADEFCTHFFGKALLGSPMQDQLQSALNKFHKYRKKLGKWTKDVGKHQYGRGMEKLGKTMSNSNSNTMKKLGLKKLGGIVEDYGKRTKKTQKPK